MSLTPFLNKHAGQTAWLFGKGPGLNHFDISSAGPLRVAINDVAATIPGCLYAFSNDGVEKWRDVYARGTVLFQPLRALEFWDSTVPGAVACPVVTYRDDSEDNRLHQPREELAECLVIRRGTLGSALQVLHIMGVSQIIAVGIDGGNAHATGHEWRTRLRRDHWKDYNAIRADAIRTADRLGLTLNFYTPFDAMNDGKIKVKMNRTCSADGLSLKADQTYDLNPSTAADLCAIGRAVKVDAPPVRETATAKPIMETAALPPAVTKKTAAKKTPRKRGRK